MCGVQIFCWLIAIVGYVYPSEFPERECCDLPSPQPSQITTTTSVTAGKGPNTKTTIAILNCLLARQLCFEDASCAAILEIIPRVCGPELVACSTVTVTKCQAALRTLQAFPFFKPTCLCREPYVDPECNSFRDILFDHPCVFVTKKEKDPYPVDALPTCNHALSVCQQERKCIKLYEDFKLNCKVRENKCRMDDSDLCHESWSNLRLSPMFGCICPNNHIKKRCDRIFSMVNHNPCVASDNASTSFGFGLGNEIVENPLIDAVNGQEAHAGYDRISARVLKNTEKSATKNVINHYQYPEEESAFDMSTQQQKNSSTPLHGDSNDLRHIYSSTCHTAMDSCSNNYQCRMLLAPILHYCDMSRCNKNSCMDALQTFYENPNFPWNIEIAFCLCKKTDNKQDACIVAQEKLHPVCAQRVEDAQQPSCLYLAEVCRENKECRARLENYEQSCAVDSITKKCAGAPSECRLAIIGILGTDLRSSCSCKGTEMGQLYECLGWQRLLWVNPCVVESQKKYHLRKSKERLLLTTSLAAVPTHPTPVKYATLISATRASLPTEEKTVAEFIAPPQTFVPTKKPEAISTTSTTTTTTTTTTTIKPTTTTKVVTTLTPRSCVVRRPQFPNQYIREGSFKRIYHEDEFECSDICECGIGEKLTCKTICIDRMPCKTEFAYYNHAAPAYQAFRGRCLCYSGRFICIKPLPGDYSLPQGIFLFLGYSEVDERELNKNHTLIVVQDIVRVLQHFINEEAINGTLCTLELFNTTQENVILAGKLTEDIDYTKLSAVEILTKEKDECAELLEVISDRINSRNPDFVSHLLLSIFKMAEVEIVQMEPASSSFKLSVSVTLMFIILFVNNSLHILLFVFT